MNKQQKIGYNKALDDVLLEIKDGKKLINDLKPQGFFSSMFYFDIREKVKLCEDLLDCVKESILKLKL